MVAHLMLVKFIDSPRHIYIYQGETSGKIRILNFLWEDSIAIQKKLTWCEPLEILEC